MTTDTRWGCYVHLPFCVTRCPYCDFYSTTDLTAAPRLLDAVQAEAARRIEQHEVGSFGTLYLGGGTPSAVPTSLLAELLAELPLAPDAEITIEANPDDVTETWLEHVGALGITRLSLGVQSFDDHELRLLGRRHDAAQARHALELARAVLPAVDLSVDLIFGLPEHTPATWARTLDTALSWAPEHLSCYQLTIEPDTPFGRRGMRPAAEDMQAELFLLTHERLSDYRHYEVSNYALGEAHIARHNAGYWRHQQYLGLGPAAHSFAGSRRWWNTADLAAYCDGAAPDGEDLTPAQLRLERIQLGLRTMWGAPVADIDPALAAATVAQGLTVVVGERLCPTPAGMAVADALALRLAPDEV